jgi:hypothetical protein
MLLTARDGELAARDTVARALVLTALQVVPRHTSGFSLRKQRVIFRGDG